jgi:hypothetical protein
MIMTGGPAADGQGRGAFSVDTDRALEALRLTWGNTYSVCFDDAIELGGGRWQAWRIGGHGIRLHATSSPETAAATAVSQPRREREVRYAAARGRAVRGETGMACSFVENRSASPVSGGRAMPRIRHCDGS